MLMFSMYIIGVIYNLLYCYLFSKYVLKEKYIINKRMMLISCFLAIFLCFNFYYNDTALKPFVSQFIFFSNIKLVYNSSIIKCLLGIFTSFLVISICEFIFVLFFINLLGISQEVLNDTFIGFTLSNIFILIIVLLVSNINNVKKIINKIISGISDKKIFYFAVILLLCISLVIFMIYENITNNVSISYFIATNLFFISVYVFMIGFFIQKSNNNKLTTKYDQLIEYSKTYEQEVVKRSKKQHEYKNQLVVIKSMIEEKDDDVINYINEILHDDDKNKDTKWLTRLTNIPLGGLKGLIYYKINEAISKDMKINLYVSEKLNKKTLWKYYSENSHDINKMIGVYIDNAIEAGTLSKRKDLEIQFFYEDKSIVICIGNSFDGEINQSKIDKEGYSTKGINRGYGIPLANDLLLKNKNIVTPERTIMDNYYVQKLKIRTK